MLLLGRWSDDEAAAFERATKTGAVLVSRDAYFDAVEGLLVWYL